MVSLYIRATVYVWHHHHFLQLKESKLATRSVKEELAEMMQRYQDKVGQWENLQEALDQLTDELEANQNLLRENQQTADQLKGQIGPLQEQVDTIKQQVSTNNVACVERQKSRQKYPHSTNASCHP